MTPAAVAASIVVSAVTVLATLAAAVWWRRAARAAHHDLAEARRDGAERLRTLETAGALAADLAHDINDVLTGIAGHAELLMVGLDPAAPGMPDAQEIFRLASRGARLTRPLRTLDAARRAAEAVTAAAPAAATILVVEDEPGVRALIKTVLTQAGYVVVATDGPRAARAALARESAVVLMVVDLVMPEMDGYDLVAAVRVSVPGLPVILISGFAPDARRQAAGDRFIAKPFTADSLTAAVAAALAGGRACLDGGAPSGS